MRAVAGGGKGNGLLAVYVVRFLDRAPPPPHRIERQAVSEPGDRGVLLRQRRGGRLNHLGGLWGGGAGLVRTPGQCPLHRGEYTGDAAGWEEVAPPFTYSQLLSELKAWVR